MNFSLYIAWRYFCSPSRRRFTRYLARFSMAMVAVGSMALTVGLSAFNGMEKLLRDHYSSFDPAISLRPRSGFRLSASDALFQYLDRHPEVASYTPVVEDYALASYRAQQKIVKIRGLNPDFLSKSSLRSYLYDGRFSIEAGAEAEALIGEGLRGRLELSLSGSEVPRLHLFYPTDKVSFSPRSLYFTAHLPVAGSFAINRTQDTEYVLLPLKFARKLVGDSSRMTSISLRIHPMAEVEEVARGLSTTLGPELRVLTRAEQHKGLYRLLQIERFFVFLVFGFILLVSCFGLFFVLLILFMEKRAHLSVLMACGARVPQMSAIFVWESVIISALGATIGLSAGLALCYLQSRFGIISLGIQDSAASYPIEVRALDLVYVLSISVGMSLVAALRPAWLALRHRSTSLKEQITYTI